MKRTLTPRRNKRRYSTPRWSLKVVFKQASSSTRGRCLPIWILSRQKLMSHYAFGSILLTSASLRIHQIRKTDDQLREGSRLNRRRSIWKEQWISRRTQYHQIRAQLSGRKRDSKEHIVQTKRKRQRQRSCRRTMTRWRTRRRATAQWSNPQKHSILSRTAIPLTNLEWQIKWMHDTIRRRGLNSATIETEK